MRLNLGPTEQLCHLVEADISGPEIGRDRERPARRGDRLRLRRAPCDQVGRRGAGRQEGEDLPGYSGSSQRQLSTQLM